MTKTTSGFTLVELTIVIVVIGIIAAISYVSYSSVQVRTNNSNRASQLQAWKSVFERYKAKNGTVPFPSTPNNTGYCLGTTGFPNGYDGVPRCRDAWSSGSTTSLKVSDNAALMAELQTVVPTLPSSQNIAVNGTVGPYVYYATDSSYLRIQGAFEGSSTNDCPSFTTERWYSGNKLIVCTVTVKF
jgi:prepilin-type N-terminal cleavage/methylation domain-containing protein